MEVSEKQKKGYTQEIDKVDTDVIKIAAIILMFVHHFIGQKDWVTNDNSIFRWTFFQIDIQSIIGSFANICVAMFAFISGYTLYINQKNIVI